MTAEATAEEGGAAWFEGAPGAARTPDPCALPVFAGLMFEPLAECTGMPAS